MYVKFNGRRISVNAFAGTVVDMLPTPTWKFVSRSKTIASILLNLSGRKLLCVLTLRSRSAAKEKLAGERENIVSGGPVRFCSGLSELKLKAGTRGMVNTRATIIL